jgi:hypothetical protein
LVRLEIEFRDEKRKELERQEQERKIQAEHQRRVQAIEFLRERLREYLDGKWKDLNPYLQSAKTQQLEEELKDLLPQALAQRAGIEAQAMLDFLGEVPPYIPLAEMSDEQKCEEAAAWARSIRAGKKSFPDMLSERVRHIYTRDAEIKRDREWKTLMAAYPEDLSQLPIESLKYGLRRMDKISKGIDITDTQREIFLTWQQEFGKRVRWQTTWKKEKGMENRTKTKQNKRNYKTMGDGTQRLERER